MSEFPQEERREATQVIIETAQEMLPHIKDRHPRWATASEAILDRLYVPDMGDKNEIIVPRKHRNDQSIPIVMVPPEEPVRLPKIAGTPTSLQRQRIAEVFKGEPRVNLLERMSAVRKAVGAVEPYDYTLPSGFGAMVHVRVQARGRLSPGGYLAIIKERPLMMIGDSIMHSYSSGNTMPVFRANGGIWLLHETIHVAQFEGKDAAVIHSHKTPQEMLDATHKQLRVADIYGEHEAYVFQRDSTAALLGSLSVSQGRYDRPALEGLHSQGATNAEEMLSRLAFMGVATSD